ncbi:uncharacterized protein TNCV_62681 [Trichonephila clavipes]|nr:uncharacterized protein TNCV_62681 [Trichonephila clavipes]
MSRADENTISIYQKEDFEIYFWRNSGKLNVVKKKNFMLYQSYKESNIVNLIKIQRIKWVCHVVRMEEDYTTKKVFNAQPIGTRKSGRPNHRWIDELDKDHLALLTKNWRILVG